MNEDLLLLKKLEAFRLEHRELDEKITNNSLDEFTRILCKKKKLALRDEIARIEQMIYPDIIA